MVSLTETARLHTSGAPAVEPFDIDGTTFVAVPQLAIDIQGQAPEINGGDSHTPLLVFRPEDGRFVEHHRLAVPGGEDAEFFRIDGRIFLATASIRTGSGPYEFGTESRIFEWRGGPSARLSRPSRRSPPNSGKPSLPPAGIFWRWPKGSARPASRRGTSRQRFTNRRGRVSRSFSRSLPKGATTGTHSRSTVGHTLSPRVLMAPLR